MIMLIDLSKRHDLFCWDRLARSFTTMEHRPLKFQWKSRDLGPKLSANFPSHFFVFFTSRPDHCFSRFCWHITQIRTIPNYDLEWTCNVSIARELYSTCTEFEAAGELGGGAVSATNRTSLFCWLDEKYGIWVCARSVKIPCELVLRCTFVEGGFVVVPLVNGGWCGFLFAGGGCCDWPGVLYPPDEKECRCWRVVWFDTCVKGILRAASVCIWI